MTETPDTPPDHVREFPQVGSSVDDIIRRANDLVPRHYLWVLDHAASGDRIRLFAFMRGEIGGAYLNDYRWYVNDPEAPHRLAAQGKANDVESAVNFVVDVAFPDIDELPKNRSRSCITAHELGERVGYTQREGPFRVYVEPPMYECKRCGAVIVKRD